MCRHQETDNIPGKFNPTLGCRVSYAGREVEFHDGNTEILVGANEHEVEWIPRHGGDALPPSAFVGGSKKDTHSPIYIGRCHIGNMVQVGKVDEYDYYAFGGQEHRDCPNHEILTC